MSEDGGSGVRVATEDGQDPPASTTSPEPRRAVDRSEGAPIEGGLGGLVPGADGGSSLIDRLTELAVDHRRGVVTAVVGFVLLGTLGASDIDLGGVVVDGVSIGAVYAMLALGIVLVYRSTGVLNFAQGELGTMPAFLVLMLLVGFDRTVTLDTSTVSLGRLVGFAVLGVAFGAVLAIAVNVVVVQRLADATPVTSLVATAGVSLLLVGTQFVVFEPQNRAFPRVLDGTACLLPGGGDCMLSTNRHNLVILAVLAVVSLVISGLFRTELGTALLATAQDPFAASLHGVSPRAMSSLAWGMAGGLGALGGVLGAGFFAGLTPGLMTSTFLVPAFTAVILGGITSMPGAVVGGLLMGLAAALANGAATTYELTSLIPSPPVMASFALLLAVLLVRPSGLFGKGA